MLLGKLQHFLKRLVVALGAVPDRLTQRVGLGDVEVGANVRSYNRGHGGVDVLATLHAADRASDHVLHVIVREPFYSFRYFRARADVDPRLDAHGLLDAGDLLEEGEPGVVRLGDGGAEDGALDHVALEALNGLPLEPAGNLANGGNRVVVPLTHPREHLLGGHVSDVLGPVVAVPALGGAEPLDVLGHPPEQRAALPGVHEIGVGRPEDVGCSLGAHALGR